jgi:hypothetical protein
MRGVASDPGFGKDTRLGRGEIPLAKRLFNDFSTAGIGSGNVSCFSETQSGGNGQFVDHIVIILYRLLLGPRRAIER